MSTMRRVGLVFAVSLAASTILGAASEGAAWIRTVSGKFLALARILKASITFDGGLDYIVWKLARHSGREIEIPERVRRHPALHMWGFFWRLYRAGVFR